MTNSADPDQLASEEANGSGSTLFAKTGHIIFSKRRVKSDLKYIYLLFFFLCLCLPLHKSLSVHLSVSLSICLYEPQCQKMYLWMCTSSED